MSDVAKADGTTCSGVLETGTPYPAAYPAEMTAAERPARAKKPTEKSRHASEAPATPAGSGSARGKTPRSKPSTPARRSAKKAVADGQRAAKAGDAADEHGDDDEADTNDVQPSEAGPPMPDLLAPAADYSTNATVNLLMFRGYFCNGWPPSTWPSCAAGAGGTAVRTGREAPVAGWGGWARPDHLI